MLKIKPSPQPRLLRLNMSCPMSCLMLNMSSLSTFLSAPSHNSCDMYNRCAILVLQVSQPSFHFYIGLACCRFRPAAWNSLSPDMLMDSSLFSWRPELRSPLPTLAQFTLYFLLHSTYLWNCAGLSFVYLFFPIPPRSGPPHAHTNSQMKAL